VLLVALIGISAGGGTGKPAGNAAPVVTLTAPPTHSHPATAAPAAIATKASTMGQPAAKAATRTRAPATATPAVSPSPTAAAHTTAPAAEPVVQAPTTPAQATPAVCHPLTRKGACYEPGEVCRKADHLISGVAGDGEPITCEDSSGWHWEPS
jgi:hypothetical protein